MIVRLILGLAMTAAVIPIAARRGMWLYALAMKGQPAPDRVDNAVQDVAATMKRQLVEVFAQRKLLKWSVPGAAHFVVFWAFVILGTVYVEAYGALFDSDFAIPLIGTWAVLGAAQDAIAVLALVGIAVFALIRLQQSPKKLDRKSRFKGSHTGGAWIILLMIFNVLWTMFFFRGVASAAGNLPYENGAEVSIAVGKAFDDLDHDTLEVLETVGLLLHIGVMLVFLVIVVYSKHMHIFIAPLNVTFARKPDALGPLLPMQSNGKALDFEEADPDTDVFGRGKVEDFTWKGFLDFATCTECGRCQSQCPAWNTGKPLSPKMVILDLRDHAFGKAPYLLAGSDEEREALPEEVKAEAGRTLVAPAAEGGVIDPDVLWSCTTCGACVEQCPVDIEHIDHIIDMRRYQVMVESAFPSEAAGLLKNLENKGNPWGMNARARMDWTKDLGFKVPVVGKDVESLAEVDYLFWVGCAGALDDKAQKTTKAVAELLHIADVKFAILGQAETCTGDPARRMGAEFVFQMLAQENVENLKEAKATKVVATCPHCFNTLGREYSQLGLELDVMHHTQLLDELVSAGKLKPAVSLNQTATYHDPCYLGRHNKVYTPPRELLTRGAGLKLTEMARSKERSFCCGAGGARMWMEETIGKRINDERAEEALAMKTDVIAVGCPFCKTMLNDSVVGKQTAGTAPENVEVIDIAQLLVRVMKPAAAPEPAPAAAPAPAPAPAAAEAPKAPPAKDDGSTEPKDSKQLGTDPGAGTKGGADSGPAPDSQTDTEPRRTL